MKIRDIMTSQGLTTATLDSTLAEIAAKMRDSEMSAIPIVDESDSLVGIVTARDIVVRGIAEGHDPDQCTAEEIIGEQLHTIHPEAEIAEAAELMARRRIRRLPVVEGDVIVGLISMDDLARQIRGEEAGQAAEEIPSGVGSARRPASGPRAVPISRGPQGVPKQSVSGRVREPAGSRSQREPGKKKITPTRSRSRARRKAS